MLLPVELVARFWWVAGESNAQPPGQEPDALPVELATRSGFRAAQKPPRLESRTLLAGLKKPHLSQKPHLMRPMMLTPARDRGGRPVTIRRLRGHNAPLCR